MNPNTIVKSGDVEQKKRVLTVRERESLQYIAKIQNDALGGGENYGLATGGATPVNAPGLNVKRVRLNEQQKQIMTTLRDFSPEPIPPSERDAYARRADYCKEKFEQYHQTRKEIHVTSRQHPEWFSAMDKARMWSQPIKGDREGRSPESYAEEYRNIKRRLEPEDDQADSLDRLRKDK